MPNEPASPIEFSLQWRKHATTPTGAPLATAEAGRLPRITQMMALAISFQEKLASGEAASYAVLARSAAITKERFSQVMQLLWLAPDIQQELLELAACTDSHPLTEQALRSIARHLLWPDQRRLWRDLKTSLALN